MQVDIDTDQQKNYVFHFSFPPGASFRVESAVDKKYFLFARFKLQFGESVEVKIGINVLLKVANKATIYRLQS